MTNITTWIDEYHKGSRFGLNGEILIKKTSKYQEIIVIENEYYGKALMLDGCWMTSLKDEKYYHECLVHPALSSIDEKSNVLIILMISENASKSLLLFLFFHRHLLPANDLT